MPKALMIALDPLQSLELFYSDKIEVVLNKIPKEIPDVFKVYVYELKKTQELHCSPCDKVTVSIDGNIYHMNCVDWWGEFVTKVTGRGRVVGKFVCDRTTRRWPDNTCLLHVTLKRVYRADAIPKSAFCKPCIRPSDCSCEECKMWNGNRPITRTPNPYLYVEELQEEML